MYGIQNGGDKKKDMTVISALLESSRYNWDFFRELEFLRGNIQIRFESIMDDLFKASGPIDPQLLTALHELGQITLDQIEEHPGSQFTILKNVGCTGLIVKSGWQNRRGKTIETNEWCTCSQDMSNEDINLIYGAIKQYPWFAYILLTDDAL